MLIRLIQTDLIFAITSSSSSSSWMICSKSSSSDDESNLSAILLLSFRWTTTGLSTVDSSLTFAVCSGLKNRFDVGRVSTGTTEVDDLSASFDCEGLLGTSDVDWLFNNWWIVCGLWGRWIFFGVFDRSSKSSRFGSLNSDLISGLVSSSSDWSSSLKGDPRSKSENKSTSPVHSA